MKAYIYIDGYNFFYRSVRGTPYKWLDFKTFCDNLFPDNNIEKINYYTARAKPQPGNPDVGRRQNEYFRALKTIKNFYIYLGQFRTHPISLPLEDQKNPNKIEFATVMKTEEKGSDVNLATHLIYDACKGKFDVAMVFSNDSDLAEPIRIIVKEMKKSVYVWMKETHMTSKKLRSVATDVYYFRNKDLKNSQFPNRMNDENGRVVEKPSNW